MTVGHGAEIPVFLCPTHSQPDEIWSGLKASASRTAPSALTVLEGLEEPEVEWLEAFDHEDVTVNIDRHAKVLLTIPFDCTDVWAHVSSMNEQSKNKKTFHHFTRTEFYVNPVRSLCLSP